MRGPTSLKSAFLLCSRDPSTGVLGGKHTGAFVRRIVIMKFLDGRLVVDNLLVVGLDCREAIMCLYSLDIV